MDSVIKTKEHSVKPKCESPDDGDNDDNLSHDFSHMSLEADSVRLLEDMRKCLGNLYIYIYIYIPVSTCMFPSYASLES